MKTVEELGLSHLPWKYVAYHDHKRGKYIHLGEVWDANGHKIVYDLSQPDARAFANAPAMYEQLRQSTNMIEHVIQFLGKVPEIQNGLRELAKKNRAVLGKAAGESEVRDE